jgi:hypothetical protein
MEQPMRVSADKLLAALVKVRILEEQMVQYCTDPMQIPVPWQSVVMAVEQYTGDKIEVVRPTTGEMKLLNGAMIRWGRWSGGHRAPRGADDRR